MNTRKMRQIGRDILAEPRRFNMNVWSKKIEDYYDLGTIDHAKTAKPPCNTVMCFAGEWAVRYKKINPEDLPSLQWDIDIPGESQNDLGMPNRDLFYENRWPVEVRPSPKLKAGTKKYAEHFVNVVLESYIRTDGWTSGPLKARY